MPEILRNDHFNRGMNNTPNAKLPQTKSIHIGRNIINTEINEYAETAINELLGWYGYNKTTSDSNDCQSLSINSLPVPLNKQSNTRVKNQMSTVKKDNSSSFLSFTPSSSSSSSFSPPMTPPPSSVPKSSVPIPSTSKFSKKSYNPLIPTEKVDPSRHTRESSTFGQPNSPCVWCKASSSMQNLTLDSANSDGFFCSEVCYSQYRHASVRRSKRCDWCQHVRSTVNCVDLQDGNTQYKFCSGKCLNQFKLDIFCQETKEHLDVHTYHREEMPNSDDTSLSLITPDMWLKNCQSPPNFIESNSSTFTDELPEKLSSDTMSYLMHNNINCKEVSVKGNSRKSVKKKKKFHNLRTSLVRQMKTSEEGVAANPESGSARLSFQSNFPSTLRRASRFPTEGMQFLDSNTSSSVPQSIKNGSSSLPVPPLLPINVSELPSAQRNPCFSTPKPTSAMKSTTTLGRTSLLPPPTVLIPYPIILPLILPIPIPIPFPIQTPLPCKSNEAVNENVNSKNIVKSDNNPEETPSN